MGRDYHTSTCPEFVMTPVREQLLLDVVNAVPAEAWEELSQREGLWSADEWPVKLRKYISKYADLRNRHDVGITPDERYMFSGGSTYGDPPTLACKVFDTFEAFKPVWNLMNTFMNSDDGARAIPLDGTVVALLANGKILRSGWIDKHDPNALPAGDFLAVEAVDGQQLFYADSADLLADPITGRKMLNEMIQACM